jgi:hypothetical protein
VSCLKTRITKRTQEVVENKGEGVGKFAGTQEVVENTADWSELGIRGSENAPCSHGSAGEHRETAANAVKL